MIPSPFLPSLALGDFEEKNDDDYGDIYKNDDIPDHEYNLVN